MASFFYWNFFPELTLFRGGSREFYTCSSEGMIDQGRTVNTCSCGASIAIGRTTVGLGCLDDGKLGG